jgi:glycine/D-amino acid oxidase-like deaminating enzyme
MWSVETFSQLQEDAETSAGWRQVGSLRIALCDERVEEFKHMKNIADQSGLEVDFIDNKTAQSKWPEMDFEQVKAVLWCPSDGYLQPSDLTMAYVAYARRSGVRFQTNSLVQSVLIKDSRVTGVLTDRGIVHCDMVINAAGAHAYQIANSIGVELPIVPVRHEFFVTITAKGVEPGLPVIRIPDSTLYLRAETNALLCGGWEPKGLSFDPRSVALETDVPVIKDDWEVLGKFAEQLAPQFPQVNQLGVRSVFKGWPTFTPDGRFIIGESNRVGGFVMAGGCNAHGVSGSAGIGRHVVESMLDPDPSPYVQSLSPNRFTDVTWNWDIACAQAQNIYQTYYDLGH